MALGQSFDRFITVKVINSRGQWQANGLVPNLPQLFVQADITKTISAAPNRATVTIANLSDRQSGILAEDRPLADDFAQPFAFMDEKVSRGRVGASLITSQLGLGYIEVRAGKFANPPLVFEGGIETSQTGRPQGHTKITTMRCSDGAASVAKGIANNHFGWRTPLVEVIKYLARVLGLTLDVPSLARAGLSDAFTQTSVDCSGNPHAILTQISRGFGVGYMIDDGEIVFLSKDGYRTDAPDIVRESDVIGEPLRRGPDLWRVRIMITAAPRIGNGVRVIHPQLNGTLRADGLRYRLQNRGGAFEVMADLRNLDPLQSLTSTADAITDDDLILSSGVV